MFLEGCRFLAKPQKKATTDIGYANASVANLHELGKAICEQANQHLAVATLPSWRGLLTKVNLRRTATTILASIEYIGEW